MSSKTIIGYILCDRTGRYAFTGKVKLSGRIPCALFIPCETELELAEVKLWQNREQAKGAADSLTARKIGGQVITRVALAVS